VILDPFEIMLVEVDAGDVVGIGDETVFVVALTVGSVDDHGVVVDTDDVVVAGVLQGFDDPLKLPGSGGAGGIPGLPGDVDLETGLITLGKGGFELGQFHQFFDIFDDGFGGCF